MNKDISIKIKFNEYPGDTYLGYAYTSDGEEIGYLEIKRYLNNKNTITYQVDRLRVKEVFRNQGIAKKLFSEVEKKFDKSNGNYLSVRPNSEPYDAESYIDIETLYTIYEKLGFHLSDPDASRSTPNHLMLKIYN